MSQNNIRFANDFVPNDGVLSIKFFPHDKNHIKGDATLIRYGQQFWLIDTGYEDSPLVNELLTNERAALLRGHPELIDDVSCKFKLSIIITHFHNDHVGGLAAFIAQNELLYIDMLYTGPISQLKKERRLGVGFGDDKFRPLIKALMEKHHPYYKEMRFGFGKEDLYKLTTESGLEHEVEMSFLPPSADWGVGERLDYIDEHYDVKKKPRKINTHTLNSASIWLHLRFGKTTFLFTGDTTKRFTERDNEPIDEMIDLYGAEYSPVTVLKYVHHGIAREEAVLAMLKLKPDHIILNAEKPTAHKEIKEQAPEEYERIEFHKSGLAGLTIECEYDGEPRFIPFEQ